MLEELLNLVAEGGLRTTDELARHMSVPQPLLEAMLADLARRGYLRPVGDGCQAHCSGCAMGGCSVAGPGSGRLWTLTDRGSQAAARGT